MAFEFTSREERLATKSDVREAFYSLGLKIDALRNDMAEAAYRADRRAFERQRWCQTGIVFLIEIIMIAGAVHLALEHWG
jgi:hypothetical protein